MRGRIDPETSIAPADFERTAGRFEWYPWPTGRGELLSPPPCEACGLVIVRTGTRC